MKTIVILGAGLIGKAIAGDLCERYRVVCADVNREALLKVRERFRVETVEADLRNSTELNAVISQADLVIGAVPGMMGFETLKRVIEAGKNCVDISFFPENPFELDMLAKKMNVTAIVDCGVAPGLCNLIAGHHFAQGNMQTYECLVGGLPVERTLPFEYKAVFSPIDVIEEYTRPSHVVRNGKEIILPALSEIEQVHFTGLGDLEAFATDGLRTLIHTMRDVPDMQEKTMRYPGHAALMKVFRDTGFFSKEAITVRGNTIVPLEVTGKILFPQWEMKSGEEDITVMRVTIEDDLHQYVYSLNDRFDTEAATTSMARTTGYTCTAAATLLLDGKFDMKGICPPEYISSDNSSYQAVLDYLAARNVNIKSECYFKTETVKA